MNCENEIKEIIVKVKENIISTNDIKNDVKFEALGIDSLLYVRVIIEIEKAFNLNFPSDKLVLKNGGTIKELCDIVTMLLNKS
jgi:acyl carrier protein